MKYNFLTFLIIFYIFTTSSYSTEVNICNPPCPPGYHCDDAQLDCIPDTTNNSDLNIVNFNKSNNFSILGRHYTKDELINTGFSQFMYSSIIYGIGTLYSTMAGISWYNLRARKYDDDYYDHYYYFDDEAIGSTAPQSSVFLVFGGIQQGAKSKQIRTLKHLGVKPAKGLVIGGMLLYGASLGIYTLYLTSYTLPNMNLARTSTILSASTLIASYIVNTTGYLVQRKMIRDALNKKNVSLEDADKKIMVLPYVGFGEKSGSAGLAFIF